MELQGSLSAMAGVKYTARRLPHAMLSTVVYSKSLLSFTLVYNKLGLAVPLEVYILI